MGGSCIYHYLALFVLVYGRFPFVARPDATVFLFALGVGCGSACRAYCFRRVASLGITNSVTG